MHISKWGHSHDTGNFRMNLADFQNQFPRRHARSQSFGGNATPLQQLLKHNGSDLIGFISGGKGGDLNGTGGLSIDLRIGFRLMKNRSLYANIPSLEVMSPRRDIFD